MSDPDELSAPRDPGSYGRPRRRPGFVVWAAILLGLGGLALGYGAARFGPDLYPAKPGSGAQSEVPAPDAPASFAAAEPAPPQEVESFAPEAATADRARIASAAAAALAAEAVAEASRSSGPFSEELETLAGAAPSLDLGALGADAERGAPSRAALAAGFPEYAARAASAARAPGEGAGVLALTGHALSRIVTLRRVGDVPGDGVDAVLARAERQVEDGDLAAALATLDALPAAGRDALSPWRERAERRARIDRNVAEARAQALRDLAELARSGG